MLSRLPVGYRVSVSQPGFRRLWLGTLISTLGDAMSLVAMVWFAAQLQPDRASQAIGLAAAAYTLPSALTALTLASRLDRMPGKHLLLADSLNRGVMLGLIAVLASLGALGLPSYLALLALAALSRPLGYAGTSVILRGMLPGDWRFGANSLLSLTTQLSSVAGPALAGLLVTLLGAGRVIGVDGVSFLVLAVVVLGLPAHRDGAAHQGGPAPRPSLRGLLSVPSVTGLFGLTSVFFLLYGVFSVALPLRAADLARGTSSSAPFLLGMLWSAFGLGFVIGGLVAGTLRFLAHLVAAAVIAASWGLALLAIAWFDQPAVAIAAMAFGGLVYAPYPAVTATVLQRDVASGALARVSSYWSMMTSLSVPAGALVASAAVPLLGPSRSILWSGTGTIAVALAAIAAWRWASGARPGGPVALERELEDPVS